MNLQPSSMNSFKFNTCHIALLAWTLLLLSAGCASAPLPTVEDSLQSQQQRVDEAPTLERSRGGEIEREKLNAFLDQGPAYLLQRVAVTPILEGERLVGYRIDSFFPNTPSMQRVDIVAGDVIIAVNQDPLERPDDFFAVWEGLRSAERLQVDVIRGNTLHTLNWEIK